MAGLSKRDGAGPAGWSITIDNQARTELMFTRSDRNTHTVPDSRRGVACAPVGLLDSARMRGFTLVELIVTILIVGILAAVALPSFTSNSPGSDANALLGALQFARSAALKQGQTVVVCPSSTGTTCSTSANWASGWIVLAPGVVASGSGACTSVGGGATDMVLQKQSAFTNKDTAAFSVPTGSGNTNTSFCFTNFGYSPSSYTGVVQFDAKPVNLASRRCLSLTGVGHIQILKHGQSDSSGVVTCP